MSSLPHGQPAAVASTMISADYGNLLSTVYELCYCRRSDAAGLPALDPCCRWRM